MISNTDPLGHARHYVYDSVGNLISYADRDVRTRTFAYDPLNRATTETWLSGGAAIDTFQYSFDAAGNLLTASDANSGYTLSYDALDRLTSTDNAGTPGAPRVALSYGYDAAGNAISTSDNFGVTVASTYDARDLLTTRAWQGGGIDAASVSFSYNARGDRVGLSRFSDAASTHLIGSTSYSYDAADRLQQLTHLGALDNVLAGYDYGYDLADQLVSQTDHGQTTTYNYDSTGQLLSATHSGQANEAYNYDANGNRTGGGYVVGPDNQVASDVKFDYAYDAEGNMISKTEIAMGIVTSYGYDYRNSLAIFGVQMQTVAAPKASNIPRS